MVARVTSDSSNLMEISSSDEGETLQNDGMFIRELVGKARGMDKEK